MEKALERVLISGAVASMTLDEFFYLVELVSYFMNREVINVHF